MTEESLDMLCRDMIDMDVGKCVPWYIAYHYCLDDDMQLIGSAQYSRLKSRLIEHWKDIDHDLKPHLTLDMVMNDCYDGEYPNKFGVCIDQLRRAGNVTGG